MQSSGGGSNFDLARGLFFSSYIRDLGSLEILNNPIASLCFVRANMELSSYKLVILKSSR